MEYDAAFTALDRNAQGRAEQQVGQTIVAAEEPDWRQVVKQASELMAATKDLRVAMHLTRGLLRSSGFQGLAEGLAVLHGLVDTFWDTVHPQLDPDDDNDPTMRVNILAELCDGATVIQWTRLAPLVTARGVGQYALRDVEIATGEIPAPANLEGAAPDMASIEAAFMGADPAQIEATLAAVKQARLHAMEIENLVTDRVGAGNAANLSKLRTLLDQAAKTLQRHATTTDSSLATSDSAQPGSPSGDAAAPGAAAPRRLEGEITSRDDVVRAIDKICAYYQRSEPTSPIPLLLSRCRRLVNKDFLGIIRDMAPDSLGQVEMLRGRTEEEDGSS